MLYKKVNNNTFVIHTVHLIYLSLNIVCIPAGVCQLQTVCYGKAKSLNHNQEWKNFDLDAFVNRILQFYIFSIYLIFNKEHMERWCHGFACNQMQHFYCCLSARHQRTCNMTLICSLEIEIALQDLSGISREQIKDTLQICWQESKPERLQRDIQ